jgi:hypothetical protein
MKLARKANISKAAWEALIPIERNIKSKPVEHACRLDNNTGEILFQNSGIDNFVGKKHIKNYLIDTHNHPSGKHCSIDSYLSYTDIRDAIRHNDRENRVVIGDGFCHLIEIPKLDFLKKLKCKLILNKYEKLEKEIRKYVKVQFKSEPKEVRIVFGNKAIWFLIRKMQKELQKVGGFKFRTIKLPE